MLTVLNLFSILSDHIDKALDLFMNPPDIYIYKSPGYLENANMKYQVGLKLTKNNFFFFFLIPRESYQYEKAKAEEHKVEHLFIYLFIYSVHMFE